MTTEFKEPSVSHVGDRLISIGGVQALTTIDFPGRIAAVFFTKGCPWNCRYCHNPELRTNGDDGALSAEHIERFLAERAGFLDGIVISGGEPTYQKKLPVFLGWLRSIGYEVAVHTNGFFPTMLKRILVKGLVDYIAMDVKAPPRAYDRVTGMENSCIAVARSIKIVVDSGVDYEFRTTYHPDILSEEELQDTICALTSVRAKRYYLQRFRPQGVADKELAVSRDIITIPEDIVDRAEKSFEFFGVR